MDQQRAFLEAELKKLALEPVLEPFTNAVPVTPTTPEGKLNFTNLYADLEPSGSDETTPLVIVASHIDTKRLGPNFVGANDGGSSTAAVLEIARALSSGPERAVGYRFLFLDGEEAVRFDWIHPDHTYGSRYHATEASKRPISRRMAAFVLLDLVGDRDLVLTKDQYSTKWLQDLFVKAGTQAGHGDLFWHPRSIPIKDDHLRFKEELGIPVIDLIDFDYGPNNRYWHSDDDTLEHCSAASLRKIGEVTLAGLVALERKLISEDAKGR